MHFSLPNWLSILSININNKLISHDPIYNIQYEVYVSTFLYMYIYKHIILFILKSNLILSACLWTHYYAWIWFF